MRRAFVNLFALLSLLACVALVALWARSYRVVDVLFWGSATGAADATVKLTRGVLDVVWETDSPEFGSFRIHGFVKPTGLVHTREPPQTEDTFWDLTMPDRDWHVAGFAYRCGPVRFVYARQWLLPVWSLVFFTAIGPTVWAMRYGARNRRFAQGRCVACGYDLRASSAQCPECGDSPQISG